VHGHTVSTYEELAACRPVPFPGDNFLQPFFTFFGGQSHQPQWRKHHVRHDQRLYAITLMSLWRQEMGYKLSCGSTVAKADTQPSHTLERKRTFDIIVDVAKQLNLHPCLPVHRESGL
jgi:hypothetical protein